VVGCSSLDNVNLTFTQDANGQGNLLGYPPQPTPPVGSGPAHIILSDQCECENDNDCPAGQVCNFTLGVGRCSCNADADCPGAGALCACPAPVLGQPYCVATPVPPGPGTPTPTPASGVGRCLQNCITNGDCPLTQTCAGGGPGSAILISTSAIGTVSSPGGACTKAGTNCFGTGFGTDCKFCTADDPQSSRGTPQTLPAVTGIAAGKVFNHLHISATPPGGQPTAQPGNPTPTPPVGVVLDLGPFATFGGTFPCSQILPTPPTPPSLSGSGVAGAFTTLNQPPIGDTVILNSQFAK